MQALADQVQPRDHDGHRQHQREQHPRQPPRGAQAERQQAHDGHQTGQRQAPRLAQVALVERVEFGLHVHEHGPAARQRGTHLLHRYLAVLRLARRAQRQHRVPAVRPMREQGVDRQREVRAVQVLALQNAAAPRRLDVFDEAPELARGQR